MGDTLVNAIEEEEMRSGMNHTFAASKHEITFSLSFFFCPGAQTVYKRFLKC
jgi:hypothetical protein